MITKTIATCILLASNTHNVHPTALYGIYLVEGGRSGMENKNTNGTYDLGVMQINTVWLSELSTKHKKTKREIATKLVYDTCFNVDTAAWILKSHMKNEPNMLKAIGNYHSKTPKYNFKYRKKVYKKLKAYGLVK